MRNVDICIVGAGLSGLAAALTLHRHGYDICVVESQSRVGGRVQTDIIDGYRCDRGFQVLLPHYPHAKKVFDMPKLHLNTYPKGASIISHDKQQWFGFPFLYPLKWRFGTRLPFTIRDLFGYIRALSHSRYPKLPLDSISTADYISQHFSPTMCHHFLKPFFQGVFIDPNCYASSELFRYYLRLFASGGAAIPMNGMQALPDQIANQLPKHTIQYSRHVTNIDRNRIHFKSGNYIDAQDIILACDHASLHTLLPEIPKPTQARAVSTYYFTTPVIKSLAPLNLIQSKYPIIQISIPTFIQSNYSPNENHVCMISCIGGHKCDPESIKSLLSSYIGHEIENWSFIHYHHIKYALPDTIKIPNQIPYHFCGDYLAYGSIESALSSGISIAKKIIRQRNIS